MDINGLVFTSSKKIDADGLSFFTLKLLSSLYSFVLYGTGVIEKVANISFLYGNNILSDKGDNWYVSHEKSADWGAENLKHKSLGDKAWRSSTLYPYTQAYCIKYLGSHVSWNYLAIVGTNLKDEIGSIYFYANDEDLGDIRLNWHLKAKFKKEISNYQYNGKIRYYWEIPRNESWVAIFFSYPQHSAGYIQIARIMLGTIVTLSRNYNINWKEGYKTTSNLYLQHGTPIGRMQPKLKYWDLEISHITTADRNILKDIFITHDIIEPFIIDLNKCSAKPTEMEYMRFEEEDLVFTHEPVISGNEYLSNVSLKFIEAT